LFAIGAAVASVSRLLHAPPVPPTETGPVAEAP
jgi:hypothetical protein